MKLRSKDGRILTTRKQVDAEDNAADPAELPEQEKNHFDFL